MYEFPFRAMRDGGGYGVRCMSVGCTFIVLAQMYVGACGIREQ